jgi:ferredoxin
MLGGRGVALSCLLNGVRKGVEDGLFLCTTCGLCEEVCPVGIDAGKRVKDLRRSALEDPITSAELDDVTLLQNTIDRYGTPYGKMTRAEFSSAKKRSPLVLYIGCVGMTTEVETTDRVIELLHRLGVDFTLIDEVCCEAVKNETGSAPNPERIRENIERMKGIGGQEVLFLCPTCLKTFLEYDEKDRTGLVFKPFLSYHLPSQRPIQQRSLIMTPAIWEEGLGLSMERENCSKSLEANGSRWNITIGSPSAAEQGEG